MEIVGYGDRLSVARGGRIRFMVSTRAPEYEAQLVRVSHRPERRYELEAPLNGTHAGRDQPLRFGSYVRIDGDVARPESFRLEAWIQPTAPARPDQALLAWGNGDGLFVHGALELRLGGERLSTDVPLRRLEWYRVEAGVENGRAFVHQEPLRWDGAARADGELAASPSSGELRIGDGFDGKIEAPRIDGIAEWDFSREPLSTRVHGTVAGEVVNSPMRGVPGHTWDGRELDFRRAREQFGAIHFHSDDLTDAAWAVDFEFDVPRDLPSGTYAIRLRTGGEEDHVPFFVRRTLGEATAPLLFLAPTFSYLAYSNEHGSWEVPMIDDEWRAHLRATLSKEDRYALSTGMCSLYDHHTDGTGNCYASRLRPIVNMRPYYEVGLTRGPHQLGADVHVTDWLHDKGFDFDVATDEDLHFDGLELLSGYRALVTGTHPEYWSEAMLDALEEWLDGGGRLAYLGGNGFYWVTSVHPERPHVVEVRRGHAGTRAWTSLAGEEHHGTTGERGGLWRHRGRTPQRLVGNGFSAQGFDAAQPYTREPGSYDPSVAWIFEGVAGETFGSAGVVLGGAGGFELDRIDASLGSPPHVVHLATTTGFSDNYQAVVEEVLMEDSRQSGTVNERVRGEIAYVDYPNGGAVFSVGSICWGTALPVDPDVSRITENVLRRFLA
jgi:N,N-dimethylformamidase